MDTEQIIKQGYIDVKIFVAGLRQSHRLTVVIEKTSGGEMPYLVSKYYIPNIELMKIAEETHLPVKCRTAVVFPKGKAPSDYVNAKKAESGTISVVNVEPGKVEAEIEKD